MSESFPQQTEQAPYDYTEVFKAGLEASVREGFMTQDQADDMLRGWHEEQGESHES